MFLYLGCGVGDFHGAGGVIHEGVSTTESCEEAKRTGIAEEWHYVDKLIT